jgi:hypothetical protein
MAWETRGKRKYYYRSVRDNDRVRKVYYGTGYMGNLAASADSLRRAEWEADENEIRTLRNQMHAVLSLARELSRMTDLLVAATLLAAGFHRPYRGGWRKWRDGRKALNRCTD